MRTKRLLTLSAFLVIGFGHTVPKGSNQHHMDGTWFEQCLSALIVAYASQHSRTLQASISAWLDTTSQLIQHKEHDRIWYWLSSWQGLEFVYGLIFLRISLSTNRSWSTNILLLLRNLVAATNIENIVKGAVSLHIETTFLGTIFLRRADTARDAATTWGRIRLFRRSGAGESKREDSDEEDELHDWLFGGSKKV